MPTLESLDYERFSYDEADKQSLTLDQAVKKAAELRRGDSAHFYRIEVNDIGSNSFRVDKVPVSSAYSEFIGRLMKTAARFSYLYRKP
jgi:uncharacterized iron-regulated membrane protein